MYKISYKSSLGKVSREYGLQHAFLKGEIEHSVINKSKFTHLGHVWELYPKLDVLRLVFIYARHSVEMQKMSGFGIKDCLRDAGLGWKCFGKYKKNRELITFNDKLVHDFIRKSIKGGRVGALSSYFESNHCEEKQSTIKRHKKK